jgi:hypothetical protein
MSTVEFVRNAREAFKARQNQAEEEAQRRFTLKRFKDIKLNKDTTYLIKGFLPSTGIALAWGAPKTYKSFWAFDLAMHIAREDTCSYRGMRVRTGPVCYLAFEGGGGFGARVAAYRQHHEIADDADISLALIDVRIDLIKYHPQIVSSIKEQLGVAPSLVILDTLNQSLVGSESSDEDMAAYFGACEAIYREFDCLALLIHHCGHNTERYRGHSSIGGTVVAEISIKRVGKTDATVSTVVAARDFEAGRSITHEMVRIDPGEDSDGDRVTSLVCVAGDNSLKEVRSWPKALSILREAIDEVMVDYGRDLRPFGANGPSVRAVTADQVKEAYMDRHPDEDPRARLKAFKADLVKAAKDKLLRSKTNRGVQNLWFWSAKDEPSKPDRGRSATR